MESVDDIAHKLRAIPRGIGILNQPAQTGDLLDESIQPGKDQPDIGLIVVRLPSFSLEKSFEIFLCNVETQSP